MAVIIPLKAAWEASFAGTEQKAGHDHPQLDSVHSSPEKGGGPGNSERGSAGVVSTQSDSTQSDSGVGADGEGRGLRPLRLNDAALAAVGGVSGFASGGW